MSDTKQKILDAAEELFAQQGFAPTSVRQLTAAAGVNLAALHYHFGSKDGLIQALFARRLGPLNQERLRLLDEQESRFGAAPVPVQELVKVFVGPPLRLASDPNRGGEVFMRLMGRAFSEPDQHVAKIFVGQFSQLARRFVPAFARSLRKLSEEEVYWRIHFMVGAMAHTMAHAGRIGLLTGGRCAPKSVDELLALLVPFLVAGLQSPRASIQEEVGAP